MVITPPDTAQQVHISNCILIPDFPDAQRLYMGEEPF